MIKLKQTVVTEGCYDKARLANIFDAPIIETGGFGIYRNAAKRELIKKLSQGDGIIIITDSDKAGFRIRNYIKSFCSGGRVWDVYLPDLQGKERRKRAPSKEGLLGVEGIDDGIIIKAFEAARVETDGEADVPYTKAFLAELGLSGGKNSALLRRKLAESLGIPANMSANTMVRVLPKITDENTLKAMVFDLQKVINEG